jgi:hypothetical protein
MRISGDPARSADPICQFATELPGRHVIVGAGRAVGAGRDQADDLILRLTGAGQREAMTTGLVACAVTSAGAALW